MDELLIIQNKIYEIRGQKVMLDFDLAEMYQAETKRLKETVRRNIKRFEGEDFMFELTKNEVVELSRTQNADHEQRTWLQYQISSFCFHRVWSHHVERSTQFRFSNRGK